MYSASMGGYDYWPSDEPLELDCFGAAVSFGADGAAFSEDDVEELVGALSEDPPEFGEVADGM
jgi:hypothetical protein